MKKKLVILISLAMVFTFAFAACGGGGGEDLSDSKDVVDHIDGAAYGYAGDDPVEAACYQYMAEVIGPQYAEAEISIPTVVHG